MDATEQTEIAIVEPAAKKLRNIQHSNRPYPSIGLKDAESFTQDLKSKFGFAAFSLEAIGREYHQKTPGAGAFGMKLRALRQYGLLQGEANDFRLTELAKRILNPVTENLNMDALREAFCMPDLFRELMQTYGGDTIPAGLPNILFQMGILDSVKNEVAKSFKESAEYVGLLSSDGRLRQVDQSTETSISPAETNELTDGKPIVPTKANGVGNQNLQTFLAPDHQTFALKMACGQKALIAVPSVLCENDIALLRHQIDLLELQVKFEGHSIDGKMN